ncbi:PfkB family carbohydrate kinase [Saccharothrix sp. AJ9571]|nr:PfkB family carbohydrate kinase [Saccharothrix sp. AJ9571]
MRPQRRVTVFAPSPQLTVTIEELDGIPEMHLHAGGQGVWQARMIVSLGVPAVLCAALGGETGNLLKHLIPEEGIELVAQEAHSRNGGYVHDRRDDKREPVVEAPGEPLSRHELDGLYEKTLVEGLRSKTVTLSGPSTGQPVPADMYRRLATDLRANGCLLVVDLSGELLEATIEGKPQFIKVSHEELLDDGRAGSDDPPALIAGMKELSRQAGDASVVISRAADPALALLEGELYEIEAPPLHPMDSRGAGDSMTAAVAASLTEGVSLLEAVRLGAAAGALNVTRRGLATGGGDSVRAVSERVELRRITSEGEAA